MCSAFCAAYSAADYSSYKPGNEHTGQVFPYTVGLPLAAALQDLRPGADGQKRLLELTLRVLAGKQDLAAALQAEFGP